LVTRTAFGGQGGPATTCRCRRGLGGNHPRRSPRGNDQPSPHQEPLPAVPVTAHWAAHGPGPGDWTLVTARRAGVRNLCGQFAQHRGAGTRRSRDGWRCRVWLFCTPGRHRTGVQARPGLRPPSVRNLEGTKASSPGQPSMASTPRAPPGGRPETSRMASGLWPGGGFPRSGATIARRPGRRKPGRRTCWTGGGPWRTGDADHSGWASAVGLAVQQGERPW